ncbi:peptidoglycan bridge formation glycyltransferase FemA/FemB family protein [Candidatus Nomurabacteria bacterium]|nr:peptidoglycan bridge formation glycyltransferase FemA/FemB family protein [Candidatus Nomurabacteria bacterium]
MDTLIKVEKITSAEFNGLKKSLMPVIVPLEQSPIWGKFDDSNPGRSFLGSYKFTDKNGLLIAIGSATLYKQKGRDWIWFKHGPIFASTPNSEIVSSLCQAMKRYFCSIEEVKPVFIRLNMPTKSPGLSLPFEHTMYDQTVIVDLSLSEDEILAGMSQSGRRGVRSSAKSGVLIEEVRDERSDFFKKHCYPILKETGSRDGFGIHPLSLYTSMLDELGDIARLYVAKNGSKVLAWAITTEYNTQAMYYYGGSSAEARDTFAAYGLHFEIIKDMKSRGNKTYDFMGIAGKNFESLKNVTQFKIKFSKNIVDVPFTYDLPLQPAKYKLLSLSIKAKRSLLK